MLNIKIILSFFFYTILFLISVQVNIPLTFISIAYTTPLENYILYLLNDEEINEIFEKYEVQYDIYEIIEETFDPDQSFESNILFFKTHLLTLLEGVKSPLDSPLPKNLDGTSDAYLDPNLDDTLEPNLENDLEPDLEPQIEPNLENDLEPNLEPDLDQTLENDLEPNLEPQIEDTSETNLEPDLDSDLDINSGSNSDSNSDLENDLEKIPEPESSSSSSSSNSDYNSESDSDLESYLSKKLDSFLESESDSESETASNVEVETSSNEISSSNAEASYSSESSTDSGSEADSESSTDSESDIDLGLDSANMSQRTEEYLSRVLRFLVKENLQVDPPVITEINSDSESGEWEDMSSSDSESGEWEDMSSSDSEISSDSDSVIYSDSESDTEDAEVTSTLIRMQKILESLTLSTIERGLNKITSLLKIMGSSNSDSESIVDIDVEVPSESVNNSEINVESELASDILIETSMDQVKVPSIQPVNYILQQDLYIKNIIINHYKKIRTIFEVNTRIDFEKNLFTNPKINNIPNSPSSSQNRYALILDYIEKHNADIKRVRSVLKKLEPPTTQKKRLSLRFLIEINLI